MKQTSRVNGGIAEAWGKKTLGAAGLPVTIAGLPAECAGPNKRGTEKGLFLSAARPVGDALSWSAQFAWHAPLA